MLLGQVQVGGLLQRSFPNLEVVGRFGVMQSFVWYVRREKMMGIETLAGGETLRQQVFVQ